MLNWNPEGDYPKLGNDSYVHPTAVIIGKVRIGKNVFVGPGAVLRADEDGSEITIEDECNIQDRVIIHGLKHSKIIIRARTSIAHGAIVHGPCVISRDCFVGFGSVVFGTEIGKNVIIKHSAVVERVKVPANKVVESGSVINSEEKVKGLKETCPSEKDFAENVVNVNLELTRGYLGKEG